MAPLKILGPATVRLSSLLKTVLLYLDFGVAALLVATSQIGTYLRTHRGVLRACFYEWAYAAND